MRMSLSLLAVSALALLGAAAWPRPGHGVLLAFAPGSPVAPAFAQQGWRVLQVRTAGPLTLVFAAPEGPEADPFLLRRASGATVVTLAGRRPGCAPPPPDRQTPWT
jgi:hypothetical protein